MHRIYAVLALCSWIVLLWPFPSEVFLAGCLACLCLPLYRRLISVCERRIAVSCMALLVTMGIVLPLAVIAVMVAPQVVNGLKIIDNLQKSGWLQGPEAQAMLAGADEWLRLLPGMERGIRELTTEVASLVSGAIRTAWAGTLGLAGSTMSMAVRLFMLIVLTMVGILYAPTFLHFVQITSRFPTVVLERIIRSVRAAIKAVLMGVVLVAVIQGMLCGLGFAVAGVPAYAFWGLLAALVAPLPIIGTGIIWMPVCIYLWFGVSKAAAVGLMIWCGLAVVASDNFLRPMLLRGGVNAPFSVVLVAVVCGLIAFGPVGVVAGPVLAAFALQAAREAERGHRLDTSDGAPW